jgi:putative ABC transport system ATP-binding protein
MTAVANSLDYAVRIDAVTKTYGSGDAAVQALKGVTLGLLRGSLDRPTSGRIMLGDVELTGRREAEVTTLRRERIGFVFQAYNLLDALTVEQNIVLPLRLGNRRFDPAFLAEVVRSVQLTVPLDRRPSKLSGGQQQRVAIARALVTRPEVMFLDEPTGALDTRTARQVLGTLRQAVDRWGQTALMVTHDPIAASHADTVVFLADGRIVGQLNRTTPEAIAERMTHLGEW